MHNRESLAPTAADPQSDAVMRALIAKLDSEERSRLFVDLAKADGKAQCLRRAAFLALVLFLFALAGLGYCAVLRPEVFYNPPDPIVRGLSVLALGSFLSATLFIGYGFRHRAVVARLHEDCRRWAEALGR